MSAFQTQATLAWPQEAVGLILTDGSLQLCANISATPIEHFETDQSVVDAVVTAGRLAAVLHSHPSTIDVGGAEIAGNDYPSAADMEHQMASAVPWGICQAFQGGASEPVWFGDQVPRAPLIGREFRHGTSDCYALMRDWHAEVAGIHIRDLPRDMSWWERGEANEKFYDRFEEIGFVRVQREAGQLEPGDCFICKIRSPVLNHSGVYIGEGLILHHLFGHLSMRQPVHIWRSRLDLIVRHRDLPPGWTP